MRHPRSAPTDQLSPMTNAIGHCSTFWMLAFYHNAFPRTLSNLTMAGTAICGQISGRHFREKFTNVMINNVRFRGGRDFVAKSQPHENKKQRQGDYTGPCWRHRHISAVTPSIHAQSTCDEFLMSPPQFPSISHRGKYG